MSSRWWRSLLSHPHPRQNARRPHFLPLVENLEERLAPAVVWTGADNTSLWSDPNNWNTFQVPQATDTVLIPTVPGKLQPVLDTNANVQDLTIGSASDRAAALMLNGFNLTVNDPTPGSFTNFGTLVLAGTETVGLAGGDDTAEGTWSFAGTGSGTTVRVPGANLPSSYFNLQFAPTGGASNFEIGTHLTIDGGLTIDNGATVRLANSLSSVEDIDILPGHTPIVGLSVIGSDLSLLTVKEDFTAPLEGWTPQFSPLQTFDPSVMILRPDSLGVSDPLDADKLIVTGGQFQPILYTYSLSTNSASSFPLGARLSARPTGLAMDGSGAVYLSIDDSSGARIVKFDSSTTSTPALTFGNTGPGTLTHADALAFGPDGLLYVLDTGANAIFCFDTAGNFQRSFALADPAVPTALALDAHGRLYTANSNGGGDIYDGLTGAHLGTLADTFDTGVGPGQPFMTVAGDRLYYETGTGAFVHVYDVSVPANTDLIDDSARVTVNAGGTFDLNGWSETIGDLSGAGSVTLGAGTLTTGGNNASTTFSGVISGSGGLTLTGTGTFTLTGASPYSGATTINGGTLDVEGTLSSDVTIGSGTLAGNGTTGSANVASGGTVSPGVLSTGSILFAGGATLTIGLTDQLNVTGTVDLGNSTLNVVAGFTPSPGQSFTLIRNDGTDPIVGTFAGLPEGSTLTLGATTFTISYTGGSGNDVVLTVPGGSTNPVLPPGNSAPLPTPDAAPVIRTPLIAVGADAGGGPQVNVYDAATGQLLFSFFAFAPSFTGGVRVAVGDVNGDGVADVIAGAGPGGGPQVVVFDGSTGKVIRSFYGLAGGFSGGVFVAAGDIDGDGFADVIVGADAGGGPQVTVWSGKDGSLLDSFDAFDPSFRGGVRVAAGDVDGDGRADIIAAAGTGGGPQVTAFSGKVLSVLLSFDAFATSFQGGVFVAAGDLNGDGKADVICGAGIGGGPQVAVFAGPSGALLASFYASDPNATDIAGMNANTGSGVRVGSTMVNGQVEIITAPGPGPQPLVSVFNGQTQALLDSFFAFDPSFRGGVFGGG